MSHRDFKPKFYEQFKCVGPRCEDSCCTHWRITVDRATYKFMSHKSALKDEVPIAFIETPHADHYAEIKLNSQQRCHFLDEEDWCRVQKVDGLAHLSDTCRLYPRKTLPRGKKLTEYTLLLSCPETVKNVLLNPKAMLFERPTLISSADYFRPPWYGDVHRWVIRVLNQRHVTFEMKMYVIARSLAWLSRFVGDDAKFEQHLCAISQKNYQYQLKREFKRHESAVSLQSYFFISFLDILESSSCEGLIQRSPRLKQLLDDTKGRLSRFDRPVQSLLERLATEPKNYHDFFKKRSSVWRNYFLYRMYIEDFPSGSFRQFFYYVLFEFLFFRTMLWLIAYDRPLTDDDLVLVVQSFHKSLHGKTFIQILEQMERDCIKQGHSGIQPLRLLKTPVYSSSLCSV